MFKFQFSILILIRFIAESQTTQQQDRKTSFQLLGNYFMILNLHHNKVRNLIITFENQLRVLHGEQLVIFFRIKRNARFEDN